MGKEIIVENPTPQEQTEVQVCHFGDNHVTVEYMNNAIKWRQGSTDRANRESVLNTLKSMVREEILDRDLALTVFNTIADNAGWDTVESIAMTYTVTVSLFGQTIGEFTEVEASDEDEAVSIVEQGFEISQADLSITVDFGNESLDDSIDLTDSWHLSLNDHIEFEATEE